MSDNATSYMLFARLDSNSPKSRRKLVVTRKLEASDLEGKELDVQGLKPSPLKGSLVCS
jgi:hypothetical protein